MLAWTCRTIATDRQETDVSNEWKPATVSISTGLVEVDCDVRRCKREALSAAAFSDL